MNRGILRKSIFILLGLFLLSLDTAYLRADGVVSDFQKKQSAVINARKESREKPANASVTSNISSPSPSQKPIGVSQNKQNQRLYISHDGLVSVYDLTNFEPIKNIRCDDVFANAMTRQDNYVYFMDSLSITAKKVDDLTTVSSIDFEAFPVPGDSRIRVTTDGKKIYVGVLGWGKSETSGVFVEDLIGKKQIGILQKNAISTGLIDISKDGQYLYIPSVNCLSVVKVSDDKEYKNIDFGTNERIEDVIAGNNHMVYLVTCHVDEKSSRDYSFRVVDIEKGVIKTVALTPDKYKVFHLLENPMDNCIYILGNKKLVKYDTNNNSFVDEKPFIYKSFPVDISPDGKYIFAPIKKENKIVVYDIGKQVVIKEIQYTKTLYDIIAK